jgi:hypothetical protein
LQNMLFMTSPSFWNHGRRAARSRPPWRGAEGPLTFT